MKRDRPGRKTIAPTDEAGPRLLAAAEHPLFWTAIWLARTVGSSVRLNRLRPVVIYRNYLYTYDTSVSSLATGDGLYLVVELSTNH